MPLKMNDANIPNNRSYFYTPMYDIWNDQTPQNSMIRYFLEITFGRGRDVLFIVVGSGLGYTSSNSARSRLHYI